MAVSPLGTLRTRPAPQEDVLWAASTNNLLWLVPLTPRNFSLLVVILLRCLEFELPTLALSTVLLLFLVLPFPEKNFSSLLRSSLVPLAHVHMKLPGLHVFLIH